LRLVAADTAAMTAAERHVHYFHGVNPLAKVFLSNVNAIGALNSVTSFYHSWFAPGTDWSIVGVSKYGPAPGYLVGGANPSYALDVCCPAGCGSATNNALCVNPIPPAGQPPMKSYKDFNDGWPVDSWQVTEPDLGYQAAYVRLLSKFVNN
jgi:endoglucanase